ncbi:MAG: N-acetyltransferase [Desulfuromonadales bacterium]|nr:N-acetyltransferase [Desulfuromonadales bacterium]MDT8423304.1 N-acetyltransferase [Desulfuromonadales bacterium]
MIRKARIADAKKIHQLLLIYARKGLMLSRSLPDIYKSIRDIYVYEEDDEVIATCCLAICWADLAEIRSLAVASSHGGRGIGRLLVEACIKEAQELGIVRVFALTYQRDFFTRLGFSEIEKSLLPQKIWGDCMQCPKFPECDEIAMSRDLL